MVGLGGSGMRALASVLAASGWKVRGSDISPFSSPGHQVLSGHCASHVDPATNLLVYSAAIDRENPERVEAARLRIPTLSYAEAVGRMLTGTQRLAVAGTHGKSTITAMAAEILTAGDVAPTVICGAEPAGRRFAAADQGSGIVLTEACEYRGNFLHLRPNRAVISGIEPDHFDCYPNLASLHRAFACFVDLLPSDGVLIVPANDSVLEKLTAGIGCLRETFGIGAGCDWQATDVAAHQGRYAFTLRRRDVCVGRVSLRVAGRHNMHNALAAAALAASAGAQDADILIGLSCFTGLRRRLQYVGRAGGIDFWDDYAHHPTAVSATIETLREIHPGRRLCAVFEPHQASRTAALMDQLTAALSQVDLLAVTDIFRARESPLDNDGLAAELAQRVRSRGVQVLPEQGMAPIAEQMAAACRAGDVIVTMGAGQIGKLADALRNRF